MASATLNSNLMEALVTRGGPVETHSVNAHSRPQESFVSPSRLSPSVSAQSQHPFLPQNNFESTYNHFLADSESQEYSISGGEATTEDEEGSVAGDHSGGLYFKRSAEESAHTSSKKRRKQIKPVRVSSLEETNGNQIPNNSTHQENSSFFEDMPNLTREGNYEALKCPHCSVETHSEDALRHHIIEDHIGRMLNEESIRNSYQNMINRRSESRPPEDHFQYQEREEGEMTPLNLSSPRWESRSHMTQTRENGERSPEPGVSLPSSLQIPSSYNDSKFGLPGLVPLGPPPFLLPFLQQQHHHHHQERERLHPTQQHLRPVSNGQPPIFNLEAYCDLCNKEFCNKYFLKTHKANKHGIYSPDICSSQISINPVTLSTPLVATPSTPSSIISTSAVSTPLTVPSLQTSPLSSIAISGSPFAGAFIAANMSALPLRPLIPPHLHGIQKSIPKSDILGSTSKNGVINIEAYCEICQKEFCNKYFLKRHKSKIHNIDIEVLIKNTSKSPLPMGKSAFERPEGWCDACRKDVGSRTLLNTHKFNIHGPHIVVPMSSSMDILQHSESSQEPSKDPKSRHLSPDLVHENFSPWDTKREDKSKDIRNEEHRNINPHGFFEHDRLKDPTTSSEKNHDLTINENERDKNEFWEQRDNALTDVRRPSWGESFQKQLVSPQYSSSLQQQQENNTHSAAVSIKEEPTNQYSDEQSGKYENSDHELGVIRDHELGVIRDLSLQRFTKESANEMSKKFADKAEAEKEESNFRDLHDECRSNQTPIRDVVSEQPRTPGAGSSTDENSRELGLIARVGQPAMVQAPPGTKFTPEQLRQLGVINPDAFCELCCKEFCNKYFLRTHRIKKHGIYTPEYSDRSKQSKEHSPLSLARILERQALEMRAGLSEMEVEIECDICRRPFPNPYLLQMHKYYIHGPGQEILHQEQLFQLQQQPIPHEHLRQIAMQAQQQKMQPLIKKQPQSLLEPQPQQILQQICKSDTLNNRIDVSISSVNKINMTDPEETIRVPFSKPSVDLGSSQMSQMSPTDISSRHSYSAESPQEPDTSEDLRKLQSMILELNRQGEGTSRCKICHKDVGNKYFLRAHLMTEHGILPQGDTNTQSEPQTPKTSRDGTPMSSPSSTPAAENQGFCNMCKKDFFSRYILQQHMLSSHGIFTPTSTPTSFLDRIRAEIESRDDRKPISTSRSYCEICNKELCNKYFMKTHMLKMHGINIENGTSGGVTCDICRKELCSKYFLRVHKQNTHGLVEESIENETHPDDAEVQICSLCSRRFKNFKWLQTHLNSDHGEEGKEKWREIESTLPACDNTLPNYHLCNVCGQQLPDLVALQIHVIKNHGSSSTDDHVRELSFTQNDDEDSKQSFKCSLCHVVCPSASVLYAHEKSHTPILTSIPHPFLPPSQVFQCSICSQSVPTIELYHQHLLHHQLQGFLKPLLRKEDNLTPNPEEEEEEEEDPEDIPEDPEDLPDSGVKSNAEITVQTLPTPRKKWKCFECGRKFKTRNHCLMHVQTQHVSKSRGFCGVGKSPYRRKLFRCRKCGAVAKNLSTLKKHLRRRHPSPMVPGVPTSHAQPSLAGGQFVMQPFLLNKEGSDGQNCTYNDEQPFVPSLVYLPVARKVQRPLTVSFCLTPA